MNVAVMGKRVRRNIPKRTERKKSVTTGELVNGFAVGLGRTVTTVLQWTFMLVFLGTVSFGILYAYRWVTTHEFFALLNLDIRGGQRLSAEEIANLGGVTQGRNVLGINIADVQRRIEACEWVERVSVTRILPDGLAIEVREREPAFLTRLEDQLYYADINGQPIVAVGVDKFISLPLLEKEDGVPVGAGIRTLLEEITRNALPFGMSQMAWIRQDSAEQFSLLLEKPQVLVQLDGTDLHATLACLIKLWADLQDRNELDHVAFMFVMPGRAWIRLNADQTL